MNLKIGKRIKALRNRDGVTQEKLADAIGVTSQAISKWENEIGYPDIEYITPIANFFNVTIDDLFGHDKGESENKIKEYCNKFDEMHRNWEDVNERIDLMRQALAEFPAVEKLLVRLATALWEKWSEVAAIGCYSRIDGKLVYNKPTLVEIHEYCKDQIDALWDEVKRFENPHTYYVDLSEDLWNLRNDLLRKLNKN